MSSPSAAPTATQGPAATPSPGPAAPVGARIDFHQLPLTPAELSGTAIGEGGGVILVDLVTGGDLFLHPSAPRSLSLIGLVIVTLVALRFASRTLAQIGEGFRRQIF